MINDFGFPHLRFDTPKAVRTRPQPSDEDFFPRATTSGINQLSLVSVYPNTEIRIYQFIG